MSAPPDKVILKAEISNMGNQSEAAVKVNLFVGGVLSGFAQLNSLMPLGKTEALFEIGPIRQENIIVTAMLEVADENAKDNVLTKSFSVPLPEEWRNVPKILGRVVERGTENGIPGIKLTLEGPVKRDALSGAGGQYKFEKLVKGQYKISVAGGGIEGEAVNVNVAEDRAYTGNNISVSAAGIAESEEETGSSVVKGQVFSGEQKNPLDKALVKLMRKGAAGEYRSEGETRTGDKGFYKLMSVKSGSYNLIFEKDGYDSDIREIELKKGAVVIIDCDLKEKSLLKTEESADYSLDEAWKIIRSKIKDKGVLSALEGYGPSDITIGGGSLKEALDAINAGKLKIKNAEVEIIK